MDKTRLRRWLLVFFLALLLPAALLIYQSYSQLKWETFYQYQKMAAELSERIDNRLARLIADEDKRPFTDYAYSTKTGDVSNALVLRSPLSNYPIASDIPGVLGYFQVDDQGQLVTPLVPVDSFNGAGLSAQELDQRTVVKNQMQQILAANRLVSEALVQQADESADLEADVSSLGASSSRFSLDKLSASVSPERLSEPMLSEAQQEIAVSAMKKQTKLPRQSLQEPPLAFEQLKERSQQVASVNNYARLKDIPLQQNYQNKAQIKAQKAKQATAIQTEQVQVQTQTQAIASGADNSARIRTFESTIDPFEFSQLDSGHFVLFRKVWLNGQRYTQGLLIDQMQFLSLIDTAFQKTSLSQMSSVLIVYQGNVLIRFSKHSLARYKANSQAMLGEELYQIRLSDPLGDLQMIYSITDLPVGPGGRLILWLSVVMLSVLLGGFYLMYRLGLKQIHLANQQQDFVSAVSHELKTPLTSIRMYGEILKQGWASEEKKRHYYDFIYDESERLSRLINNVLQLARMNRNEQVPQLSVYTVEALVRDIQPKIASQLEVANFKLSIELDKAMSHRCIAIDEDWLMQVMINLVDNAIKFSAKAARNEVIFTVSQPDKNHVQFTVTDFGPGIDKQHMKAIFTLFYRSENELTRDTVGTGIGLSLVHQMVSSMGGKVTVKNQKTSSQAGISGASFNVIFPVVTAPDTA